MPFFAAITAVLQLSPFMSCNLQSLHKDCSSAVIHIKLPYEKSFHTLNPMNGVLGVFLSLCNFIWSFVGKLENTIYAFWKVSWSHGCSFFIVIFRHFIICQESENIHVLEHHLKYILSPTLCDADIDNFMLKIFKLNIIIISEFSIFLLSTLYWMKIQFSAVVNLMDPK